MKQFLFLFFLFGVFCSYSQQGLQSDFVEQDSTLLEQQKRILYQQLISGDLQAPSSIEEFHAPTFDFMDELKKRYTVNLSLYPAKNYSSGMFPGYGIYSFSNPLIYSGKVLSEAAYNIGKKFTLGGYSYGANTIFSAPLPNQNASYFDTYGSTLFMQYKVSKNFKIETRINVSKTNGPGF